MKVGQELYRVTPGEGGKPEVDTWIVRTIRGGKITAIWKVSFTWGKRSSKHGDYGWLKSIPAWCRSTWSAASMERTGRSGPFGMGLWTTRRKAIDDARRSYEEIDFDTPEEFARFMKGLGRMKP